jgi:hypothetical protein
MLRPAVEAARTVEHTERHLFLWKHQLYSNMFFIILEHVAVVFWEEGGVRGDRILLALVSFEGNLNGVRKGLERPLKGLFKVC